MIESPPKFSGANEKESIKVSVKDIDNSVVRLQVDEFVPKYIKMKSHCTNCTNCGRCSW